MLDQLRIEAANYGLKINAQKTKILTNKLVIRPPTGHIGEAMVHVLDRDVAEKYLGRKLRLEQANEPEL